MMKRGHDVESAPNIWRRRTAMEHYAGIDVSLELSSVCVVDAQGKIVKEAKVASEPEAVVAFFEALGFAVKRIGLEAGPWRPWRCREAERSRGGSIVALAAGGIKGSRVRNRSARDAACESGLVSDDGKD